MPPKNANTTVWDDKARSDLLIAVLNTVKPTKQQWDEIVAKVEAKGYHYTPNAVQQHLNKLQKKMANGGSEQSTPTTPAKKPRGGKGSTPASKRKAALKAEDGDDSSEMETPLKKKTRNKAQAFMGDDEDEDSKFKV
ncbi:hypothetical protein SODALDRAFT_319975 [Sodiomyces alkalinus F11]|uniref:Myb-like domain-containing protein n=1 Tax=Sodiomyces alkalinus (strain CBS 110278 / VKM F-3762 / F11) TaxID=1314773 RepID=A0A3N2Q9X0_SODAK|nr:hypothetical protein SODALDRAFT_319975 [Sodiomyces alkalinus F11]ROT43550.1 hypothetical protein SODALDRAFT_319975 [Sodiomyces alkalinus F11]